MALSRQTIEEIQSFAIDCDSGPEMSILKQPAAQGEVHLVISLGGSGADMLREVKGLINRNLCADHDKNMAPERVAYLALDTDAYIREYGSGKAAGRVILDEDEIMILSDTRPAVEPASISEQTHPWIFRWLDPKILRMPSYSLNGSNGSGATRQVGRLRLFMEIENVIGRLRTAITKLLTEKDVRGLTVHILSGISGGTGSGTFLDMAYIVRQVAGEVIGAGPFGRMNVRYLGYLLMPDVNLLRADSNTRRQMLQNAGAALQELDQAMKLPETGDYYKCQYSETMTIMTDRRPFDFVYLISAKSQGESLPEDRYRHSLGAVAEHILSMASGASVQLDPAGQGRFWQRIYSSISAMQNQAVSIYKERPNCYLSLGYDCWEYPADKLAKQIFTHLFAKAGELAGNEPAQNDADNLLDSLGLGCERIINDLLGETAPPLNPMDYTGRQLFGSEAVDLTKCMPFIDSGREIDNTFINYADTFETRLKTELQQAFVDLERGPVWVDRMTVTGAESRIDALDKLIAQEKSRAAQKREAALQTAEECLDSINAKRVKRRPVFMAVNNPDEIREYVATWNRYFRASLEVYCYDLLIGTEDTLRDSSCGLERGFYDEVLDKAEKLHDRWLPDAGLVIKKLDEVVRKNKDEFI